jgi:DNA-binding transcriptional MerR regulator
MTNTPPTKYTIKDLERLSGIKAHTIRAWEQRYAFLNPDRTDTNIRYYNGSDLRKLLNVAVLNQKGIKISKIVEMSDAEMNARVIEFTSDFGDQKTQIEGLVIAMIDLDEQRFDHTISGCILRQGFEGTMLNVVYPFFKKVGVLWQTGSINVAQEHFISNLIRQKLIVAVDSLPRAERPDAKKYMLFLPNGELHEMGLLFYNYIIQKSGHKVVYLGQSVPLADLKEVMRIQSPDFCVTALLSYNSTEEIEKVLQGIVQVTGETPVYVVNSFQRDMDFTPPSTVRFTESVVDFKQTL